ncbi:hypothetical protein BH10BAC1_BH10BAC1_01550 [soil metagenome]
MLFDIFAKTINLFLKQKKEKVAGESGFLQIQKRQLFHKDIPDLVTIKNISGDNFNKLLEIFNRYDAVKSEKLKENPNKYEFLTKTVLYKLPTKRTRQEVSDLIALEFSLWFKHAYNDFSNKDELIDEVANLKNKYLKIDPFESRRIYNK